MKTTFTRLGTDRYMIGAFASPGALEVDLPEDLYADLTQLSAEFSALRVRAKQLQAQLAAVIRTRQAAGDQERLNTYMDTLELEFEAGSVPLVERL